jgi:hypothetical protein
MDKIYYKEGFLNEKDFQVTLTKYLYDLPLFKQIVDKGRNKTKRVIRMYYDNDIFIGYLIYVSNYMKFNKHKELKNKEKKSFFNTININNVEIRESVRIDKSNPRYGKNIIVDFINDMKPHYDGITLQGNTNWHLNYYKESYGFIDLKSGGNEMVLWF